MSLSTTGQGVLLFMDGRFAIQLIDLCIPSSCLRRCQLLFGHQHYLRAGVSIQCEGEGSQSHSELLQEVLYGNGNHYKGCAPQKFKLCFVISALRTLETQKSTGCSENAKGSAFESRRSSKKSND